MGLLRAFYQNGQKIKLRNGLKIPKQRDISQIFSFSIYTGIKGLNKDFKSTLVNQHYFKSILVNLDFKSTLVSTMR